MEATCSQIANFEGRVLPKTFFDLPVPLLDVLGGGVRIKCGKADRGRGQRAGSEHGRAEVQTLRKERCGRCEVIGLLRLGKNVGHIVALVAPGVLINGRVENPVGAVENDTEARKILRDPDAGSEVVLVGIHQALGIAKLAADEDRGDTAVENQVRVGAVEIIERTGVFITESQV